MIVVRTLGTAEIAVGDFLLKPTSPKKFALLLYLTAERGRHTNRAVLQELLFPELPEKNARHALRELVYQLRQLGAPLEADNDGVGLPSEAVRNDYSEVMDAVRLTDDQVRAVEGGFLPGYAPGHSESYAEWLDTHRADVVSNICRRLSQELDAEVTDKSSARAERIARAYLALDPINEKATRVLAESLLISGSRAEANAVLANYRDEVGRALFVRSKRAETWPAAIGSPPDASRFIGRERELHGMLGRLALVRSGLARSIAVVGTIGIGKSRLLREFGDIARLRGAILVQSRSYPSDANRPLSVLTDILPQLIASPGALGCSPDSLARLKALADGGGAFVDNVSREENRDSTFASIRELIEAVTDESPLVVLLDDFHWADDVSRRFFDDILHSGISGLLVICATRPPGDTATIGKQDRFSLIRLSALTDDAARTVIRTELPSADSETLRWLSDACAGNPLYLQLLIAQARTNSNDRGLPPAMLDAIDGHVGKLSSDARAVLLYSVLLGRHLSVGRLLRLTSRGPLELALALEELVRSGLLPDTTTDAPQPHRLVAERIGCAVSQPTRLVATRCVAELLTEDAGEGGTSLAWDAAHLWLAVGDTDRACRLIESCAAHAFHLGHVREGALLLRDAARVCGPRDRIRLLIRAASIAAQSNELDLVLDLSNELRSYGESAFPVELAIAELHARLCWGHDHSALTELRRLVSSAPNDEQRRRAAFELLRVADAQRDSALSEVAFAELAPWLQSPDCDPASRLRILISYHASFGDETIAKNLACEAVVLSESMPPYLAAQMKRLAGVAFFRAGAISDAISAWNAAFHAAELSRSTRSQFEIAVMIASTASDIGDPERAGQWEQAAQQLIDQLPDLGNTLLWLVHQCDVATCRGDVDALLDCRRRFVARASRPLSHRASRWLRALDAHIEILRDRGPLDHNIISALLSEQRAGEETGDASDFEMSAVLRIYLQKGEHSEARKALSQYLCKFRVRHAPLWSSLRTAIEHLQHAGGVGCDEQPNVYAMGPGDTRSSLEPSDVIRTKQEN